MSKKIFGFCFIVNMFVFNLSIQMINSQTIAPKLILKASGSMDQDDMCIWIHPNDPSLSTIITSDKNANKLFVYDLSGNELQTVSVSGMPGNIDIRYGFPLGDLLVDIVVYNDRDNNKIAVYKVDPFTRRLEKLDNGSINTGSNYGICLYHSLYTNRFYVFTAAKNGNVEQYELIDIGDQISGTKIRSWNIGGQTEGCVCDDETAQAYFGEEDKGIWKFGTEPDDSNTGKLIARVNDISGLKEDVEGITLYYAADGEGYIIASSQGNNTFKIYNRKEPHDFITTFKISEASSTDGIDVTNMNLGSAFPNGIFCAHSGATAVFVCDYADIGIMIDIDYWDPRIEPVIVEPHQFNGSTVSQGYYLYQNFPNPFNIMTTISYHLYQSDHVKITIYDVTGHIVSIAVNDFKKAGTHTIIWDAVDSNSRQFSSAIYLCHIQIGSYMNTIKMLLMK